MRRRLVAMIAATAAMASSSATRADICLGGCFSVNGKKGPYIATVDSQKVALARQAYMAPAGAGKGLSDQSLNKGAYYGYGLDLPKEGRALDDLVAQMRQVIIEKWPALDPGQVKVQLIASTTYAPVAQPDHTIIIPLGFLMRAKSKDEVAWVLGHEMSHIALAHFARSAEQERRKQSIDAMANVAVTIMELQQVHTQNTGHGVQFYEVSDPDVVRRSNSARDYQDYLRLSTQLYSQGVSREQEDQADASGADIVMAIGLDAEDGAHDALSQIKEDDERAAKRAQSFNDQFGNVLKSSIQPAAVNDIKQGNVSGAAGNFFGAVLRNTASLGLQKFVAVMSTAHRPTSQRLSGMHNYFAAAYKGVSRDTESDWIKALQDGQEFADAVAAVAAHDTASELLDEGKAEDAAKALSQVRSTAYANRPFIADIDARIQTALGDWKAADALYDKAEAPPVRAPPALHPAKRAAKAITTAKAGAGRRTAPGAAPSADSPAPSPAATDPFMQQGLSGYEEHVSLLASHGEYAKSKLKIAEAEHRFGDHEAFLPDLIYIAMKSSRVDDMQVYLDECRQVEEDALWERCKRALLDESVRVKIDSLAPAERDKAERVLERTSQESGRGHAVKDQLDKISTVQSPQKGPVGSVGPN
jgi:hypothetical protein